MSSHCHVHSAYEENPKYRRALWIVLALNAAMFVVEVLAGLSGNSMSLLADALDFAGDAGNIAISLLVINAATALRAKSSLFKAVCMVLFSTAVLVGTIMHISDGTLPKPEVMGWVGLCALAANLLSVLILYKFREGDSNMISVWLCTRNDAVGNILVIAAAGAVYLTSSNLPDAIVALLMIGMSYAAAWRITKAAVHELREH